MKKRDLSRHFYGFLQHLFEELDQESIQADVAALIEKAPETDREQIAQTLIRRAARQSATVGAAAGGTMGPVGLLAIGPDIFNLVRQQSRLVLAIAFLYGQKPRLPERFREVLATLAVSAGAAAGRQGVRRLVAAGIEHEAAEKLARKIAGRVLARHLPVVAPIVGSVLGGTLNYLAVRGVGKAAVEYYSRLAESHEDGTDRKARKSKALTRARDQAEGRKQTAGSRARNRVKSAPPSGETVNGAPRAPASRQKSSGAQRAPAAAKAEGRKRKG